MMEQLTNFQVPIMKMWLSVCLFAAIVLLGDDYNFISSAKAQMESIKVDLSVIHDVGISGYGSASRTGLKIPPKSNPVSQLYVIPQRSGKFEINTSKRNLRAIKPKNNIKAETAPATLPPIEPLATSAPPSSPKKPAPIPVPVKKVVKALASSAPLLVPKPLPLKKNKNAVTSLTPTPPKKTASSIPPLPPKLAVAQEPLVNNVQVSKKNLPFKIAPGQTIQIKFEKTATKLPETMQDTLRKLADGVRDKKELWLRLMAYANADGMTASKARRLSLSRALSVRSFLIKSGVRSTRIGVMALGNKSSGALQNRVDISISMR
jgi:outer membrane protein OmpA-like peptidoglycan-associated protein